MAGLTDDDLHRELDAILDRQVSTAERLDGAATGMQVLAVLVLILGIVACLVTCTYSIPLAIVVGASAVIGGCWISFAASLGHCVAAANRASVLRNLS
jgi:uncharacterized membrane protein HdeD (DUF308 family)